MTLKTKQGKTVAFLGFDGQMQNRKNNEFVIVATGNVSVYINIENWSNYDSLLVGFP